MTEDEKKQVAVFRHGVIFELASDVELDHGEQERLLKEKCGRKWKIPFSPRTRISRSTILDWVRKYKKGNKKLETLYPASRSDQGRSRSMDEDTCLGLVSLKKEMPGAVVPYLIKCMDDRGMVTPGITLNPPTVYRFLHGQGLMKHGATQQDRRKFEAELPNDLWQSDVMHGPKVDVDGKQRKTFLTAIIDDHSRLIPHAEFYLSEKLTCYLDVLEQAFLKRGLPRKLYVDNGPAFRSHHLEYITASLNISLIHARPYMPQGKGKIERWFKTVRTSFLPGFKGHTLDHLNETFDLWVNDVYHQKKHRSIGETPFKRFTSRMECIRPAPDNLKDHFRNVARRKVAKDRTITFKGCLYEAPVCLIGKQVEVLYHANEPDNIEIRWENRSYGIIRHVDLHINCRVKRDENNMSDVIITGNNENYEGGELF